MESLNTLLPYHSYHHNSSPPRFFSTTAPKWQLRFPRNAFSTPKRRRGTRQRKHTFVAHPATSRHSFLDDDENALSSSQNLKLVLDLDQIRTLTVSKVRSFVASAEDAYYDLRTLVSFDDRNRVVFSCRQSTLEFAGSVFLCGFVAVFVFRTVAGLVLGFKERFFRGSRGKEEVVVRRDRSLGGKEVVVARRVDGGGRGEVKRKRALDNPLSLPGWVSGSGLGLVDGWRDFRARRMELRLPKWWPADAEGDESSDQTMVLEWQECQREANRLVRGR